MSAKRLTSIEDAIKDARIALDAEMNEFIRVQEDAEKKTLSARQNLIFAHMRLERALKLAEDKAACEDRIKEFNNAQ